MSFFESLTKRSKLKAAIKQTTEARGSQGIKADQLFNKVYHDYAEVVADEPLVAEALYNWGFALLHQARTKSGETAANLYQDAIAKFSFCLTIEPAYLGAAIDGGVAYMELARVKAVEANDALYESATSYFKKANAIQAGSASYNLACIYGLRNDKEGCLTALEISKGKGSLPVSADILADPDMAGVKDQDWFIDFMASLNQKPQVPIQASSAVSEAVEGAPLTEIIEEASASEETEVAVKDDNAVAEQDAAVDEDAAVNEKAEVAGEAVKS